MNKFLVVGSGAASVGAIYGLIDKYGKSISIDIVTSEKMTGKISGPSPSPSFFMPKKTKQGKLIQKWESSDESLNVYDSRAHSMTQFWGAGMMPSKLSEATSPVADYASATAALLQRIPILGSDDEIDKFIGLKSHNSKWPNSSEFPKFNLTRNNMNFCSGRARISISTSSEKSCIECGKCMSGCPEDVIWHSLMEIEKISKLVSLNVIHGEVVKLSSKSLVLSNESQNAEIDYDCYKSVLFCTGVVSTIKTVLNSIDSLKKIEFYDTPVYTIPYLIFGCDYKQSIALSNDMIFIEGANGTQLASVYPFIEDIWETQFFKLFKKIGFIKRYLEKHLCFIRVYSNKTNSLRMAAKIDKEAKLALSRDDWEMCDEDKTLLSNLNSVLRSKKVYSLPLRMTNLNSAHYYGGAETSIDEVKITEILREKFPKIQFADAFNTNSMPSISTTFSIMVNGYCKAQELNHYD
jgi:ferredoxin